MTLLLGGLKRFLNRELSGRVEEDLRKSYGFEELERIPGTRHNYSFSTGDGRVVKYFTDLSVIELELTLMNLLHGRLSRPGAEKRAVSEERFRERFPEVNTSTVLEREGRVLVEEELDGITLDDAVRSGEADPRESGRRIGEVIRKVESEGCVLWDIGPTDFIYSNGEFYLTDVEWFSERPSKIHGWFIRGNFLGSSRTLPEKERKRMVEGFREEAGEISPGTRLFGIISYYLF